MTTTLEPEASPEDAAEPFEGPWWSRWWPVIALGVLGVLISIVAKRNVFPHFSWNRDEPVYIAQIHTLRGGRFTMDDGGMPLFFHPWLHAAGDGNFFSQYTLGWPLVLLAGDVVFGSPTAGIAFGVFLAIVGTYVFAREITREHVLSLVAAAVLAVAPIIPIQGGIYLGYVFTLGVGMLFAAALLAGVRLRSAWRLVAAGLLIGWIFFTRPFDAVLWGVAVAGYVVVVERKRLRELVGSALWFALGVAPLFVATLAYNNYMTGKFTKFPITAADPLDQYGFGKRRIMPKFGIDDYTITQAVKGTGKNGFYVPLFLFGTYVGVLVAAWGLWTRRRDRTSALLVALIAVFPAGYFFFWGMQVSSITARISGPIYFVPLYAPLSILIASVLVRWWKRDRRWGIALLVVLVVATVPLEWNRLHVNRRISMAQAGWQTGTDTIPRDERALVFVQDSGPYLLFLNPYSENNAELSDRVLFATDHGSADIDLIAKMKDRVAYRQTLSYRGDELGPREKPNTTKIRLVKLSVMRSGAITLRARITAPKNAPVVETYLRVGRHFERRTVTTHADGSPVTAEWTLVRPGQPDAARDVVALSRPYGTVYLGIGYGTTVDAAHAPRARQGFSFRVRGPNIEMVLPPVKARVVDVDGRPLARPTFSLPELQVDPVAANPS